LRHRDRELGLVMIYNYHLADATLRLAVNGVELERKLSINDRYRNIPSVLREIDFDPLERRRR
jgi:hypothetical protein